MNINQLIKEAKFALETYCHAYDNNLLSKDSLEEMNIDRGLCYFSLQNDLSELKEIVDYSYTNQVTGLFTGYMHKTPGDCIIMEDRKNAVLARIVYLQTLIKEFKK